MKNTKSERPCRVFLCYRGNTAQYALNVKDAMESDGNDYGKVLYSDLEPVGNFILDIRKHISEAEWVVFFIGEKFTSGFINESGTVNDGTVTAMELIEIEKERQRRASQGRELKFLSVNIDGECINADCVKDLKLLFLSANILREDSLEAYRGMNRNRYDSRTTSAISFVKEIIAPCCTILQITVQEPHKSRETASGGGGTKTLFDVDDRCFCPAINDYEQARPYLEPCKLAFMFVYKQQNLIGAVYKNLLEKGYGNDDILFIEQRDLFPIFDVMKNLEKDHYFDACKRIVVLISSEFATWMSSKNRDWDYSLTRIRQRNKKKFLFLKYGEFDYPSQYWLLEKSAYPIDGLSPDEIADLIIEWVKANPIK